MKKIYLMSLMVLFLSACSEGKQEKNNVDIDKVQGKELSKESLSEGSIAIEEMYKAKKVKGSFKNNQQIGGAYGAGYNNQNQGSGTYERGHIKTH